ncbi:MAG: GDP-mannose 4,6-dehydratase, partial [Elusimicrobiota bacterium]|nr:GDP-mannose 4,6-dehydratase [Elusimicrobiota bacterium]
LVFHKGKAGESYNLASGVEIKNYDLAIKICAMLDEIFPNISARPYSEQIAFTAVRPGHDKHYSVNFAKAKKELKWKPVSAFDKALKDTVLYYISKYKNPR